MAKVPKAPRQPKNKDEIPGSSSCSVTYTNNGKSFEKEVAWALPSGCTTFTDTIGIGHLLVDQIKKYAPLFKAHVQKYGGRIIVVTCKEVLTYEPSKVSEPATETPLSIEELLSEL